MPRSSHLARAVAVAALLLATNGAFAQEPQTPTDAQHAAHHDPVAAAPRAVATQTAEKAGAGAEVPATMDLEAIEAELDLLVTRMNESEGESRVDAMADLLATLVRQHRAMCGAMRAEGAADRGCCQDMGRPGAEGHGTADKPEVESPNQSP